MFKSGQHVAPIGAEPAKVAVVQQNDLAARAACLALRDARQTRNQSLGAAAVSNRTR